MESEILALFRMPLYGGIAAGIPARCTSCSNTDISRELDNGAGEVWTLEVDLRFAWALFLALL
jgi:hypothetical protein